MIDHERRAGELEAELAEVRAVAWELGRENAEMRRREQAPQTECHIHIHVDLRGCLSDEAAVRREIRSFLEAFEWDLGRAQKPNEAVVADAVERLVVRIREWVR